MSKVWFITGTSKGFGRIWAEAALERGDRVAATARDADHAGRPRRPLRRRRPADRARRHRQGRGRRGRRRRRTSTSAASTSSSTTPATASSARSRRSPRSRRARRSRRTCSARCGSPRRRCRSCASRAPATSSRCRRSAACNAFPTLGLYHASKWGLEALQPVAGGRGRGLRHQGHDRRAGRLHDRLGRPVVRRRPSTLPAYDGVRERRAARARGDGCRPRRPGGHRPGDPRARRRRRAAAARLLRHRAARHDPRRVRAADRGVGAVGRPGRRRPGRSEGVSEGHPPAPAGGCSSSSSTSDARSSTCRRECAERLVTIPISHYCAARQAWRPVALARIRRSG